MVELQLGSVVKTGLRLYDNTVYKGNISNQQPISDYNILVYNTHYIIQEFIIIYILLFVL